MTLFWSCINDSQANIDISKIQPVPTSQKITMMLYSTYYWLDQIQPVELGYLLHLSRDLPFSFCTNQVNHGNFRVLPPTATLALEIWPYQGISMGKKVFKTLVDFTKSQTGRSIHQRLNSGRYTRKSNMPPPKRVPFQKESSLPTIIFLVFHIGLPPGSHLQ